MPGFSAIIYFFLGLTRTSQDDKMIHHILNLKSSRDIVTLLPAGLTMNQPIPVFSAIADAEIEEYRKRFN